MTNCPNCGAPITSRKCEYCGTVFNNRQTPTGYPVYDYKTGRHVTTLLYETNKLQEQENMKRIYQDVIDSIRRYRGTL